MARDYGLLQRVRRQVPGLDVQHPPRILAGLSGGADSTALLLVLSDLARLDVVDLRVCQVDHGVRRESGEDAEHVRSLGRSLGLDVVVRKVDPDVLGRHKGVGLEEALRRERFRSLGDVADEVGCSAIALGHQRDDQVESVLMHLFRGAGLHGMGGMRPVSTIGVPWWEPGAEVRELVFWRPLLDESPRSLRELVTSRGHRFLDDPTNNDPRFRRNAVRHEVVPAIERVFPGSSAAIAGFAASARDDDDLLQSLVDEWLARHAVEGRLDRSALEAAHIAVRRRAIRRWLVSFDAAVELPLERVEKMIDAVVTPGSGRVIEIGSGVGVRVARRWLEVVRVGDTQR